MNTLLPVAHTGCPRADPSAVLDRMALLLWSGGPWRTLGAGYTTVFQTFTKWTAAGVFERAYATMHRREQRPLKRNMRVEWINPRPFSLGSVRAFSMGP